jgi:hypothetical protein
MMRRTNRLALGLLLAAAILPLGPGCGNRGPKPVPVSGVVTIDGKPLTCGFLRVVPEGGRPSGSTIGPDGRFTLGCFTKNDGCLPGTHKVEVQGAKRLSETSRQWLAPRRYASTGTSGLTVTIDKATDAIKIELTWAGSSEKGPFLETMGRETRGGTRPGSQGGNQ